MPPARRPRPRKGGTADSSVTDGLVEIGLDPGATVRFRRRESERWKEATVTRREADGSLQPQPVFCLLRTALAPSLRAFLDAGQRKIDRWTAQHRCATVVFDDADAFFNANTLDELGALQRKG